MKKPMIVFMGLLLIGAFSACENKTDQQQQQLHSLSSTDADRFIQHGQTTKEEIIAFLGHDFTVELDAQDRERWIYSHVKTSQMASNFIPFNVFYRGFNIKQTKLIIQFDENDVVISHKFHRYDDQLKVGI